MRKGSRWAALGALAVLAFGATGCAGDNLAPTALKDVPMPDSGEVTGDTAPLDARGPACAQFPPAGQIGSLKAMADLPAVAAAQTPMLTDFAATAQSAGMSDELNYNQRSVTIFVPDNAAFDALRQSVGAQRYQQMTTDPAELTSLLKSSVVAGRDIPKILLAAGTVTTLAGSPLTLKDTGSGLTVTDGTGATANVVCGNIPTQNAVIYVVDKVLTPVRTP